MPRAALSRGWHALTVPASELRLHATLDNGQCFGWHRQPGADNVWVGVLGSRLFALKETESDCEYRCLSGGGEEQDGSLRDELRDFFQLDTPLGPLHETWTAADQRMATVAHVLPGMRVLQQEPVECLFSFICSSNNNIGRIGGMLQALRRAYGEPLPPLVEPQSLSESPLDFEPLGVGEAREFYTFPTAARLAAASEADLRALGLGYRAAYVRQTAQMLLDRGDTWLPSLRTTRDADAVRQQLTELSGVGPKVADCVALFALDQVGAIPVDTHVWDIACRDLDPSLTQCGSLTPKVYNRVGELFRGRYGEHAGWAHSLLFAAELPLFRGRLPQAIIDEMSVFRERSKALRAQEKADRAEAKAAGKAYKRPSDAADDAEPAEAAAASAVDAEAEEADGGQSAAVLAAAAAQGVKIKVKKAASPKTSTKAAAAKRQKAQDVD